MSKVEMAKDGGFQLEFQVLSLVENLKKNPL